jgi:tripartite-type tricarboxylate transporter receptor subunit TctC
VSTTKRASLLLDVPPIAQAGVPGYAMSIWWGVLAPAGTPNAIAEKLNREIAAVLSMPESKQWLENEGADVASMSRADFGRLLATEVQKWTRVARESNIKAE